MAFNRCPAIQSFNRPSASDSFSALRPPLKRNTANRPGSNSRTVTEPSDGLGTCADVSFAGITNAIVAFDTLPDMNTGVVIAIFCFASLLPVIKRNNRLKPPSAPFPLEAIGVSTTVKAG